MGGLCTLNVEGLALDNRETVQLRGMTLEELNIAGTNISDFKFIDSTPNLKKLIISKGQMPAKKLEQLSKQLEIIEK